MIRNSHKMPFRHDGSSLRFQTKGLKRAVSTTVQTVVLVVQAQSRSLGETDRRDQANWRTPSELSREIAVKLGLFGMLPADTQSCCRTSYPT